MLINSTKEIQTSWAYDQWIPMKMDWWPSPNMCTQWTFDHGNRRNPKDKPSPKFDSLWQPVRIIMISSQMFYGCETKPTNNKPSTPKQIRYILASEFLIRALKDTGAETIDLWLNYSRSRRGVGTVCSGHSADGTSCYSAADGGPFHGRHFADFAQFCTHLFSFCSSAVLFRHHNHWKTFSFSSEFTTLWLSHLVLKLNCLETVFF